MSSSGPKKQARSAPARVATCVSIHLPCRFLSAEQNYPDAGMQTRHCSESIRSVVCGCDSCDDLRLLRDCDSADFCGHRGFTHSLLFASILAILALGGIPSRVVGFKARLAVAIFLCCCGQPRIFGCHDEWRPRRGVLRLSITHVSFFLGTPSWFRRYRLRDQQA